MRILSVIFCLLLIFQSSAFAETTEDVDGWSNTKWGMTKAEVSDAFPGQVIPHEGKSGQGCYMKIDGANIVGSEFVIVFDFDCNTKKLKGVSLAPKNNITRIQGANLYEKLYDELKVKYGSPTKRDNSQVSAKTVWIFPSTKIEMNLIAPGATTALLILTYEERKQEDML